MATADARSATLGAVAPTSPNRPRNNSLSSHRLGSSPRAASAGASDLPRPVPLPADVASHAPRPTSPPLPGILGDDIDLTTLHKGITKQIDAVNAATDPSKAHRKRLSSYENKGPDKNVSMPPPSIVPGAPKNASLPPGSINAVGMGSGSGSKTTRTPPLSPKAFGADASNPFANESDLSSDERAPKKAHKKRDKTSRLDAIEAQNAELLKMINTVTDKVNTLTAAVHKNQEVQTSASNAQFGMINGIFRVIKGDIKPSELEAQHGPARQQRSAPRGWQTAMPASSQAATSSGYFEGDDDAAATPSCWELCCGCWGDLRRQGKDTARI